MADNEINVIIATSGDLSFLDSWRPYLSKQTLIIVAFGAQPSSVPEGFHHILYTRKDAEAILGAHITLLGTDLASAKAFGMLVSKARYVFTLDEDCVVAMDTEGQPVDPVGHHLRNLSTPSTPYYFNTL